MDSDLTKGELQNFFQSRGAKKSKIADKISSKQEVLKRGRVKIVLVVK
jgi:hypothetical protein